MITVYWPTYEQSFVSQSQLCISNYSTISTLRLLRQDGGFGTAALHVLCRSSESTLQQQHEDSLGVQRKLHSPRTFPAKTPWASQKRHFLPHTSNESETRHHQQTLGQIASKSAPLLVRAGRSSARVAQPRY
jgi:hypothetical protein